MITGCISASDYLQAVRLDRRSVTTWINISAVTLGIFGLVALVAGSTNIAAVFALCVGLGVSIAENFFSYVQLPRRIRRIHAQRKDLRTQFIYSWDDQHIYINAEDATTSTRTPWNHYMKVKENKHMFLLYRSDDLFEILPKAWFPNAEQIDEFRRLAFRRTKP